MSVIEKEGLWSLGEIQKLFKLKDKVKSRQTLFNAEERGEIPTSIRVSRGKTAVRMWSTQQLPKIGERYGFLQKPKGQEVLCIYTAKGGVLKTTLAYSLGRALALNGIKTIIIGLDIQCSVTEILLSRPELSALEDYNDSEYYGLYQFLYGKVPFKKIIKSTDLPTLDIIPELPDLNLLEKKLRLENRREYVFRDKILPKLKDYDVVIFDMAQAGIN
ncbi:MAG: ParA family protein [Gammaproteobacteria bacterium]